MSTYSSSPLTSTIVDEDGTNVDVAYDLGYVNVRLSVFNSKSHFDGTIYLSPLQARVVSEALLECARRTSQEHPPFNVPAETGV